MGKGTEDKPGVDWEREGFLDRIRRSIAEIGPDFFDPPVPFQTVEQLEVVVDRVTIHGRRKMLFCSIMIKNLDGKKKKVKKKVNFEEMDGILRVVGEFC